MPVIASCHCGDTKIELAQKPTHAHECNCSFCARAGAIWGFVARADMTLTTQTNDTIYSASGGLNQHHFCARCGMQTWGDSPDWAQNFNIDGTPKDGVDPDSVPTARSYYVNLRLIDGLDWTSIHLEKVDGRNNW